MLQTGQETPEVLADRLTLRVTDWQNVGTKLLVKGEARLCVLYRGEQQGLCIHEAALPFSQILDGIEAAEDGECAVEPLVIEAQTRVLRTEGACGFGVSAQVSLFVRQWRQERVQLVEGPLQHARRYGHSPRAGAHRVRAATAAGGAGDRPEAGVRMRPAACVPDGAGVLTRVAGAGG